MAVRNRFKLLADQQSMQEKDLIAAWPFSVHAVLCFVWMILMLQHRPDPNGAGPDDQASTTDNRRTETLGSLLCTFPNYPHTCAGGCFCTCSRLFCSLRRGCQTCGPDVHGSPFLGCPGRPVAGQRCCQVGHDALNGLPEHRRLSARREAHE